MYVESRSAPTRRRRFAPKSRLGCVNCKCSVSQLDCRYEVPKTWIFEPKSNTSPSSEDSRRLSASTLSDSGSDSIARLSLVVSGETSDGDAHLEVPSPGIVSIQESPYKTQHEFDAVCWWTYFAACYVAPRAAFAGNTADIWTMVIPQIAIHSGALRQAMVAAGTLTMSLATRELGAAQEQSTTTMLRYATRAIRQLASRNRPIIETVLTAWTFHQMDMMAGKFKSAMMHIISAMKIAQQSRRALSSDALASAFIQGMIAGWPDPEAVDSAVLDPPDESDPVDVRKAKAVQKLEQGYRPLISCIRRVAASDVPEKAKILAMLDEARQEVHWVLSKWKPLEEYALWLENVIIANAGQEYEPDTEGTTIFSTIIDGVDEYIANRAEPKIEEWDVQQISRVVIMTMLTTAGDDLLLRQDLVEFAEFAKQIREQRKPTLPASTTSWIKYGQVMQQRFQVSRHRMLP